jgi:hypothetical protein
MPNPAVVQLDSMFQQGGQTPVNTKTLDYGCKSVLEVALRLAWLRAATQHNFPELEI